MMSKKQILIVEDNAINREILREILSCQYHVLEAEHGQQALEILQQHQDTVSLIMLDMKMPVLDGYAFLDHMKEHDVLRLIPVIVTTESDSEADEIAALAHGATDFVPKPYRPQVILHRVASLIKLRETAAMVNLVQYDKLTGLYSKEFFYQKVRERLEEHPEKSYTIICSNIENFKLYNDVFGAAAGDRLLQQIASLLRKMSGPDAICGRFHADRFLCLQERQDRMRFPEVSMEQEFEHIVMKWGIYEITDDTVTVEQMCDRAQLAMESAKGKYNQHFAVYDDALRSQLLREKAITDAMESAVEEKQFEVYYQPKYSLHDNCMSGVEALVRWNHPQWGFMSPGEFIPLFEKNGFISTLDQYVWEQVCAQIQTWKQQGYTVLPISVNVSRADLYQTDFAKRVLELTQKYEIEPANLHLEITESAYAENPAQIIAVVEQLRRAGFIIEMDDFGSGYSSLNMLNQMSLNVLKLDMQFVQNEMAKPAEKSILRFVVRLAHWINLSVVAEGVETREQLERLREVGFDYAQGYFFAKPLSAAQFETLLEALPRYHDGADTKWHQSVAMGRSMLVVDEDAVYRQKVCKLFEEQFQILEAADGPSALACIGHDGKHELAVVILSTTLPDNAAADILQKLRQNPRYWRVPVLSTVPWGESMEELSLAMETDDFLCKCHPINDLRRRISRLVGDRSMQEREDLLYSAARRDATTGLLNMHGFHAAVDHLQKSDLPLAVCMFDLDGLQQINDKYGRETGDRILIAFSDLLRYQTRVEDIQCRYGEDEFVIVLRHLSDVEMALHKGKDICRLFREKFVKENLPVACSGGIAMCGANEIPSVQLLERAERALYRAKRENQGDCCVWYGTIQETEP